jgi:tetratricopeptide (TPR) repeat protein
VAGDKAAPPPSTLFPKITDFGLAKRFDEHGQTRTGAVLGTPSYMAPEQAVGMSREAGPLADVYALGAILYEMLTGQPPFLSDNALKTLEQVVSQEPVAPRRLEPKVPRDLETICLKCLHKVPQLRYASAWELAEDLRRFRTGEPIQARPVSAAERLVKWVRRRPALAGLVLLGVLAGLGLAIGGLWHNARLRAERDRAEHNFERARRAVDEMLTEVGDKQLAAEPRMERKRRALLEKALAFYQEFLQEKGTDKSVRREAALAHKRVGDISRLLHLDEQADGDYREAIVRLDALAGESPAEPQLRQDLAWCHNFRGEVLREMDRPADARQAYEAAVRIQRQLIDAFPAQPAYRSDMARTLYNLGILAWSTNRDEDARGYFVGAVDILEELAAQYPNKPEYRQHLARCYLNRGPVLRRTDGVGPAQNSYERATALLEQLRQEDPDNPDYQHELGVAQNNWGILLADAGRFGQARAAHQQALELFGKLAVNFPSVPVYRKELASTHNHLGFVYDGEQAPSRAEQQFTLARKLFGELVGKFADVPDYQVQLARTLGNLAWLRTEQKDWAGARPLLEEAVGRLQAVLKANPANRQGKQALCEQCQNLAETLIALKDHAAAAAAAAALPAVWRERPQDYYHAACFLGRCTALADNDDRLGGAAKRRAVADRYADQAVQMLREALQKNDNSWKRLPEAQEAEAFRLLGRRDDFRKLRDELPARTAQASR